MKQILFGGIFSLSSVTPVYAHMGEGMHMEYIYMSIFMLVYILLALLFIWVLYRMVKAIEDYVEHKKSLHK